MLAVSDQILVLHESFTYRASHLLCPTHDSHCAQLPGSSTHCFYSGQKFLFYVRNGFGVKTLMISITLRIPALPLSPHLSFVPTHCCLPLQGAAVGQWFCLWSTITGLSSHRRPFHLGYLTVLITLVSQIPVYCRWL